MLDEWGVLRVVAIVAAWVAVAGGALMAAVWFARGGVRAFGPEDQLAAEQHRLRRTNDRSTSFTVVQLGMHALLGLAAAAFVTYVMTYSGDRTDAYVGALVFAVAAAIPGVLMFRKWRRGERPIPEPEGLAPAGERVEDGIPRVVAYFHGLAALAVIGLAVALLLLD